MVSLRQVRRGLGLSCAAALLACAVGCRFHGGGRQTQPSRAESVKALETEPWGQPDAVVAEVNGRPITRGEFYLRVLRRFGTMQILTGLLKEELFLQEAQRLDLKVDPAKIDERVDEIFAEQQQRAGGLKKLEEEYRRQGLSLATVREDLGREVSTQLLIGEVTKALRTIDDEVILQYYKRTYSQRRYMTRQIAYSFYTEPGEPPGTLERRKLEARSKALRAVDSLRNGADFTTLARAESEDPVTAKKGGWLGPVNEQTEMTVPAFKQAIFKLQPGEVSDPVESPGRGYHIFQVTEIRESESFPNCRDKIVEELKTMEPDMREIAATLSELERRGTVQLFDAPFVSATPKQTPINVPPEAPVEDAKSEAHSSVNGKESG